MSHPSAPALTASTPSASGCPSLRRIVPARDGGICRVRLIGGTLSVEQAKCVASASKRFGNGVIELTNRANLQLRGVLPEHEAELIATLLHAGLGDASDQADAASNLLLSPLAGQCRHAVLDVRPLAHALLQQLQQANAGGLLSPKFSMQLDGGESLTMLGHHHDIWFSAVPPDASATQDRWFAFGMAGSPPTSEAQPDASGTVHISLVPELASALLRAFLTLRTDGESRMRDVVRRFGTEAMLRHAFRGLLTSSTRLRAPDAALRAWRRTGADADARFGAGEQAVELRTPALWYVGGQAPLGRLHADALLRLATLAEALHRENGDGDPQDPPVLKITPWQGVLLSNIVRSDVEQALSGLHEAGLIVSATQPLGALVACTGSRGCAKGHADTKADAHALAKALDRPLPIHLSGCERSCAAAHPMPLTLLAQPSGRYDLYQTTQVETDDHADDHADHHANNHLNDHPDEQAAILDQAHPRFGRRVAAGLTIDQAAAHLLTLKMAPNQFATDVPADVQTKVTTSLLPPSSIHSSLPLSIDTSQKSHA